MLAGNLGSIIFIVIMNFLQDSGEFVNYVVFMSQRPRV